LTDLFYFIYSDNVGVHCPTVCEGFKPQYPFESQSIDETGNLNCKYKDKNDAYSNAACLIKNKFLKKDFCFMTQYNEKFRKHFNKKIKNKEKKLNRKFNKNKIKSDDVLSEKKNLYYEKMMKNECGLFNQFFKKRLMNAMYLKNANLIDRIMDSAYSRNK
jgi:hypothetical protein